MIVSRGTKVKQCGREVSAQGSHRKAQAKSDNSFLDSEEERDVLYQRKCEVKWEERGKEGRPGS